MRLDRWMYCRRPRGILINRSKVSVQQRSFALAKKPQSWNGLDSGYRILLISVGRPFHQAVDFNICINSTARFKRAFGTRRTGKEDKYEHGNHWKAGFSFTSNSGPPHVTVISWWKTMRFATRLSIQVAKRLANSHFSLAEKLTYSRFFLTPPEQQQSLGIHRLDATLLNNDQ